MEQLGLAGRIARSVIDSPLVPLFVISCFVFGAYSLLVIPREDRPDINLPTATVTIPWPGAGPERIDDQLARRSSAWVRKLASVTEVRSSCSDNAALLQIEFEAGTDKAIAYARLQELFTAHINALPAGAGTPQIETYSDDHLVMFVASLSSATRSATELGLIANEISTELEQLNGVRSVSTHGANERAIEVVPDLQALAAYNISLSTISEAVKNATRTFPVGRLEAKPVTSVAIGTNARTIEALERIPVGTNSNGPVYLKEVATIRDGQVQNNQATLFWQRGSQELKPAVTLAVTTLDGTNVSDITRRVEHYLALEGSKLIPPDVELEYIYDAGADATARVYRVLNQLLTGTLVVVAIIWLGLGWRAGLIIAMMMPASLAVVPWLYQQINFSLNPVSIASMILAIGILSDDAVVILENITRRFRDAGTKSRKITIKAINEVGNPTILADLLIVVTLMPTAYITGEMGQYVRAIPIGASAAVMFSLLVALLITPYFGFRLLQPSPKKVSNAETSAPQPESAATDKPSGTSSWCSSAYCRIMHPLLTQNSTSRYLMYISLFLLLGASFALPAVRMVEIGLTPMLDRQIFAINLELPAGAPLVQTLSAAAAVQQRLKNYPEVKSVSVYAGTHEPQILVPTHIPVPVLNPEPHRANIHVELVHEDQRERLSYEVSQEIGTRMQEWLRPYHAKAHISRIPYSPSNDRDITAELYGGTPETRAHSAAIVQQWLERQNAVIATEQIPRAQLDRLNLNIDPQRAAMHGVPPEQIIATLNLALRGEKIADWPTPHSRTALSVILRLNPQQRTCIEDLHGLYIPSITGAAVPLLDLVEFKQQEAWTALQRRNLRPVLTVAADLDRSIALPLTVQLESLVNSQGVNSNGEKTPAYWLNLPDTGRTSDQHNKPVLYWAGEWEMTRDVYRDLGVASAAAMLLIYVLIAGWFSSYTLPLLIMLPIPLIFIGVIPAHWLSDVDIAGTGILGIIALTGIVTRNSILLVDFIKQREKEGMELKKAVLEAGIQRTRPILLTAATVMFGSGVLIFEPSLKPLGLSLASGVLISTPITLVLIPVLYFHVYRRRYRTVK